MKHLKNKKGAVTSSKLRSVPFLCNNKKGAIPTLKTIIILLITSVIFISFVLILMKTTGLTIEDKKIQTQIIQNKIFNSDCFSTEYGIIDENKFNQNKFDECFKNFPSNMAFTIQIEKKTPIYVNEQIYNNLKDYCSINSNILCTNMKYPITLKTNSGELKSETLIIQTIIN